MYPHEEPVRFSESILWDLLKRSYEKAGISAWESGDLPSHVSSNAFIAARYVRVIEGFMRDLAGSGPARAKDAGPAVTIVEVGAGAGRLAYLIVKQLLDLMPEGAGNAPAFRYVMTDYARANIEAWDKCGAFARFIDRGIVDFAHYDSDKPGALRLIKSGDEISANSATTPLVVVANYVLDTLRQDQFRIRDGALMECLVTVVTEKKRDLDDPRTIRHVALQHSHRPVELPYYNMPILDGVLDQYMGALRRSEFLLPVGMLRCLDTFARMSRGPMLALIGDRGYRYDHELEGLRSPSFGPRVNYFWYTGNFNAIEKYVRARDGTALLSDEPDRKFVIGAFVFGAKPAAMAETRRAFETAIRGLGPVEVHGLLKQIAKSAKTLDPATVLYALKLSNWDPRTLLSLAPAIAGKAGDWQGSFRRALLKALARIGEHHYPLGITRDVPYRIGRLYQQLDQPEPAVVWFQRSLDERGDHHLPHYRLAQCHRSRGDAQAARVHALRCVEAKPAFSDGKRLLLKLEKESADR